MDKLQEIKTRLTQLTSLVAELEQELKKEEKSKWEVGMIVRYGRSFDGRHVEAVGMIVELDKRIKDSVKIRFQDNTTIWAQDHITLLTELPVVEPVFTRGMVVRYTREDASSILPKFGTVGTIVEVSKTEPVSYLLLFPEGITCEKNFWAVAKNITPVKELAPPPELKPGMFIRYDGTNHGDNVPKAGSIGMIDHLDGYEKPWELVIRFPPDALHYGGCYGCYKRNVEVVTLK